MNKIESSFLNAMRSNGIEISDDAVCRVMQSSIELGISKADKNMIFASDVTLYAKGDGGMFGRRENEINFGASGSFTPSEKGSYWRTIHAASILKNWESVSEIVNAHCKIYRDSMVS